MTGDYFTEKRRIARTIVDIANEYDIDVTRVMNDVRDTIAIIQARERVVRKYW